MSTALDTKPDPEPKERQSLEAALASTFMLSGAQPFADRIAGFAQALLNARSVHVVAMDGDRVVTLAQTYSTSPSEAALEIAADLLGAERPEANVKVAPPVFGARICLENTQVGCLLVNLPQVTQSALALSHERLTLLSSLSFATFNPTELSALRGVLTQIAKSASAGHDDDSLQDTADQLAAFSSADYAAIARYDGETLSNVNISGQAEKTRRATLPDQLKSQMLNTARTRLVGQDTAFAGIEGQTGGLVFSLAAPRRNANFLPLIAAAAAQSAPGQIKTGWNWRKTTRRIGMLVGAVLIGLIPIPDGVDIPATVSAKNHRIITSPLAAPLLEILVRENEQVTGGETVLARLDTRDIDIELIAAQADYSSALLERESARAARLAAELRNAELEVERLDARVTLLQRRRDSSVLVAPISGLVIGEGLSDLQGAVLRLGDEIMQVADPSALELDLAILQTQIGKIEDSASGVFRPDFDPTLRFDSEVTRVSPSASTAERSPQFPGTATLPNDAEQLRPGMTGVLAVNRTPTPIWQIVWTAVRDWALLRLWI